MKKLRHELENLESYVKDAYNGSSRILTEKLDKPFDIKNPELGYSYKITDKDLGRFNYNVVVAKFPSGYEYTEFRIKIHEYGHIYFSHFEGIYEELDKGVCNVFRNYRGQIIDSVNKNCGIDFGEELVERVIDDPVLNHSLHNIAMDMEVNSKLLSNEDVEEMEDDITKVTTKLKEDYLNSIKDKLTDEGQKKKIDEKLDKMKKESTVKLILPCRYHLQNGDPFPDKLTYPEYLNLMVKNLDQFVKMLVSVSLGMNGDTSKVTKGQLEDSLKNGIGSLEDLMKAAGMSDDDGDDSANGTPEDGDGVPTNELGKHDTSNSGGFKGSSEKSEARSGRDSDFYELDGGSHKDHGTASRDEADEKRELGEITAGGGAGCGNSGGGVGSRKVKKTDLVDSAIDEAVQEQKSRVIKISSKRDMMAKWNRGINRTVIAPSILQKIKIDTNIKIVYLIDISGSMDTELIDRILATIGKKMKSINKGLRYDLITWNTRLEDHIKDIDPKKGVPNIYTGGGTRMAGGIKYFKENYDDNTILIIASDFEDYLEEWVEKLNGMKNYSVWGFNYGISNFNVKWPKNFKLRNFNKSYV